MKKLKEEKTCENCRYFLQHYVKSSAQYFRTYCGHCINTELPKKTRRERDGKRIYRACELWEPIEIQKEERRKSMKVTLRYMAEKIQEMAMILKDDQE